MMAQLDSSVLDSLREVGGDSLIRQLCGLFLDYTPVRLEGIREAIATGNGEALAYWSHSLRSGAVSIGSVELAAYAGELETLARGTINGGSRPTPHIFTDLLRCYDELKGQLETRFGERACGERARGEA